MEEDRIDGIFSAIRYLSRNWHKKEERIYFWNMIFSGVALVLVIAVIILFVTFLERGLP